MSATDELLANNATWAAARPRSDLPRSPATRIAVLACMDARLDVFAALGLKAGDAHVIRNAGGAATDDAIRSLAISQRLLGTEEIILIHHTDCGMLTFSEEAFRESLLAETGTEPQWPAVIFSDLQENVRRSIARIRASPFLLRTDSLRGFVYEVDSGRLVEVV